MYRMNVQPQLEAFFAVKRKEVKRIAPDVVPLFDTVAEFVLRKGGKRIRGFLMTQGYRLITGKVSTQVTTLSILAELLHAYLLIHDDIIDQDEQRRGGKTVHIAVQDLSPAAERAEHYGVSQAILLGNLLSIWARELVLESRVSSEKKFRLLQRIERMLEETHYGQMMDILFSEREKVTEAQVLAVHQLKTAMYSFEAPLHLGAILAGGTERDLKSITLYAIPLGIAFQIQDDILGMFGNAKTIGKSVTSDLDEGKKTLLILYALKFASLKDRKRLRAILSNERMTESALIDARRIVQVSGALAKARERSYALVQEAKSALAKSLHLHSETRKVLGALAEYMVRRSS